MKFSAISKSILLVAASVLVFSEMAKAQTTVVKTLVVVDPSGKQIGPFGYSDSVEQGVVVNLSKIIGSAPKLWVLVPFGVSGVPENCPDNGGCVAATTGAYRFYVGANCEGTPYLVVTRDILNNSRNNPYSLGPGANGVFYLPDGTPQSGKILGIGSENYVDQFGVLQQNSCEPAWFSPQEMFAPLGGWDVRNALGFGPFSIAVP
jgi:hypothetical protein